MRIVWLAKRHYTHKDALKERYGRVYQLPLAWVMEGAVDPRLELVDYYGSRPEISTNGRLHIRSTPLRSIRELRAMRQRIVAWRPDTIIASGDCFLGLLGLQLARESSARFVFDVYDDYRKFGAYRVFLRWDAFNYLLTRSDLVFYASEALADQHSADSPSFIVPNGVDPELFRPCNQAAAGARVDLPQDGTRWIGYFGSMEPERGPEDLVQAVSLLYSTHPSVRLVLCGTLNPRLRLDSPLVDFRGNVDHRKIPDFINACDVVVLPYRRGPIIDMASSVKIAEYLYCRRPMVTTDTPNLRVNFAKQAQELGDAICRPSDPRDLARALDFQIRHPTIASVPTTHTWTAIANSAFTALRELSPAN
jgi:glycosyltransferase involved in cell wall biosynthesis